MKKIFAISMTINALLVALLVAQSAQAKVRSYDAVKLAQYEICLNFAADLASKMATHNESSVPFWHDQTLNHCAKFKP